MMAEYRRGIGWLRATTTAAMIVLFSAACGTGGGSESPDPQGGAATTGPETEEDGNAAGEAQTSSEAGTAERDEASGEEEPFRTEIDNSGPVRTDLIFPGEPGYLEALGVDAVRVTRTGPGRVEVTEFDMAGTVHEMVTYAETDFRDETWRFEGEIYEIEDGVSRPRMYGVGLLNPLAILEVFVDGELLNMLAPSGEVTDGEGNQRQEYRADPEELLTYKRLDTPEQWEWRSAEFRAMANNAGAVVLLEEVLSYVVVPPSNMIDPPPPREANETVSYVVEPIGEPVVFPATGPHPDSDDILANEVLRIAENNYDSALTNVWFDESLGEVTPSLVWETAQINRSPVLRFVRGFGQFAEATDNIVGLEDGILVLRSESGTWFCIAGRRSLDEPTRTPVLADNTLGEEVVLDGSGASATEAADICRAKRTEFVAANGG